METKWLTQDYCYKRLLLVGDVGGTNTNIALVGESDGEFTIIVKCSFKTDDIVEFSDCLKETLGQGQSKDAGLKPSLCCISGAGPVSDNYCKLTNSRCVLDGDAIEKSIGIKTLIINDFSAISYSLPLLDVDNPDQITRIPHLDGSLGEQCGNLRAVAGAGTGLGVGFLTEHDGKYFAHPSEGGHIGFADFDDETRELKEYVTSKINDFLEVELLVSGMGITNIFNYFKDVKKVPIEGVLADIDRADDDLKPAMISDNAESNPVCRDIFRVFVKLYGRFAGDVAAFSIPSMGMYLAGGIVTKNEKYFLEDDMFMKNFEYCYHPNIRRKLKSTPVYIIKDYSVSLYGAANAAVSLMV